MEAARPSETLLSYHITTRYYYIPFIYMMNFMVPNAKKLLARFEVFTAVKIQVEVF